MAWIRTYTKTFPSFSLASQDRTDVARRLGKELGPDNVKVRIKHRAIHRYEVIAWRSDTEAAPTPRPEPPPTRKPSLRAKGIIAAAVLLAAMGSN
jgi:hypothetical protein